MLKTLLLTSTALLALSGAAIAADLPARSAPALLPPPIPVFSWTGLYVGAQVGYAFGRDSQYVNVPGFGAASFSSSRNGVIGGGHIGYNFAPFLGNGLIFGLEGDFDAAGDSTTVNIFPLQSQNRKDFQGSVRGRLGFAVNRALFYATGGAAFAEFHNTYTSAVGSDSYLRGRYGFTVGGGVEYALDNNWSIRGEYRYSDFGSNTDNLNASVAPFIGTAQHHETEQRVQAGFSYKFGTLVPPPPVVARY